jgi:Restriction endonuclease
MAHIDAGHIAQLLAGADAEDATNATKGAAFEKAIRYAFEKVPGVACRMQDTLNALESEEIDLLFSNLAHEDGLSRFETEVLVEAKNWSKAVGSLEINWFATKMRRRNQTTGVLVAAKGITGDKELLTAAHHQVSLALAEGQRVVILLREELEAVSNGKKLAQLLDKKCDHLVGQQTIYLADLAELRGAGTGIRLGSEAFDAILRGERTKLIEEAKARRSPLPDGQRPRALAVGGAFGEIDAVVAAHTDEDDPRGAMIREALMQAAGLCVAWLHRLGFDDPKAIRFNTSSGGMDRVRSTFGSRQWQALTGYLVGELERDDPEIARELLIFDLTAILIEEILRLDNYWPEPWEE